MIVVPDSNTSLAKHLQELIHQRLTNPWLSSFSQPITQNSSSGAEVVQLDSSIKVHEDNTEMAASRLARVFWPAIKQHAQSFQGKTASVVVGNDIDAEESNLAQSLNVDLIGLEERVRENMQTLGMNVERLTLYTIRLGKSSYNIVTVHCDCEPNDWALFRDYRASINEGFGTNLRLSIKEQAPVIREQRSDQSLISSEEIAAAVMHYKATRRDLVIPKDLEGQIVDWRDVPFFRIDDSKTKRPEDLIDIAMEKNGDISLKIALPIIGSRSPYFTPFDDLYCIGVEAIFDHSGQAAAFNVKPVIAHNTCALDFRLVNSFVHGAELSASSKEFRRLQQMQDNPQLVQGVEALFRLANRIATRQIAIGSPISIDLLNGSSHSMNSQGSMPAEFVIATIQSYAQHLMARWTLSNNSSASIMVLRPQFKASALINEMQKTVPWLEHFDLYQPEQRQKLARELIEHGREDLISQFADATRVSIRQRRLKVASRPEELLPEDSCRFKVMRSIVGTINNLQIFSALLGGDALSRSTLTRFAHAMNSRKQAEPAKIPPDLESKIKRAGDSAKLLLCD